MKLFLSSILIMLFYSCLTEPTSSCGVGYKNIDGECYSEIDIGVLQSIINNTSIPIDVSLDINSNDTIEPLELQIQKWNKDGRLTYLWLYNLSLSGAIPENIGDLFFLDTLNLSYNELSGSIPESLSKLENLNWLYLKLNNLSGTIPDTICHIYPNLNNISFAYNQLCPPYPECIPIQKIGAQDTTNCSN